ncbi:hypothetical protein FO519_009484, partial [Halicephalobus sp. NKZ332]
MKLMVIQAVYNNSTIDDLLGKLGNMEENKISFVKKSFETELLKYVKSKIKEKMVYSIIKKGFHFIDEVGKNMKLNSDFFKEFNNILIKNNIKSYDERIVGWPGDFCKFYRLIEDLFLSLDEEQALIRLIIEWFEAGEMSLNIWKQWKKWFDEGAELEKLTIDYSDSSSNDLTKLMFADALKKFLSKESSCKEFSKKKELDQLLSLYLEKPKIKIEENEYVDQNGQKYEVETTTVDIVGGIIFLSLIKEGLEEIIKDKNIEQIDIIARNTFYIDCDLDSDILEGKNLSISAEKINVWSNHIINVSGKGYEFSEERKANDGNNGKNRKPGENGKNGRDGKPGESSGNITIITKDMINPELLTVILNGGNGENGENGGKGGDGEDGKEATKEDLDGLCVEYESLYTDNWETFEKYNPEGWTATFKAMNSIPNYYIFYEFEHTDGRKIHYTYGADAGWIYNWYELVFWIKGADGTPGGIGGENGKGGEGGSRGECTVMNPDTGQEYPVKKDQRNGNPGKDGKVGECGKNGKNGNDMAIIDRSAREPGKHVLITNELQQTEIIKKVEKTYKQVISAKDRDLDVIAELIEGVHDTDLEAQNSPQSIVKILQNPSDPITEILNQINDCICSLREGFAGLRDTQRMAIMYAVHSNKNLLSQVNTGEGKSYIVAAIAIIRAKSGDYKFIDIITSSPVLAQRDATEMRDIYEAMGLSVNHNCDEDTEKRK